MTLQERIDAFLNLIKEETYEGYLLKCVIRAFIHGEIEEMTKKYPKHKQFNLPHKVDSLKVAVIDWKKTAEIMEQKNIEREEWFKQVFGDVK